MRLRVAALCVCAALCGSAVSASGGSVEFAPGTARLPAARIGNQYGLAIARALNQHLVTRGQTWQVPWILVAVRKPFDTIAPVLKTVIEARFGVERWSQQEDGSMRDPKAYPAGQVYAQESGDIAELADHGIRAVGYRYVDFATKPYNEGIATEGRSRLRGQLIDAREAFGCPGAVLALERRDMAIQPGMIAHNIPIPTKNRQEVQLISEQEIAVLEAVAKDTESQLLVFGLRPSNPYLSNVPDLRAAKQWLCG